MIEFPTSRWVQEPPGCDGTGLASTAGVASELCLVTSYPLPLLPPLIRHPRQRQVPDAGHIVAIQPIAVEWHHASLRPHGPSRACKKSASPCC